MRLRIAETVEIGGLVQLDNWKLQMKTITFKRALWPAVAGTGLIGHIHATYDDLVKAFGRPDTDAADKWTVQWIIQFDDGTVATIYDWKTDATPKGPYMWHVGGKSHAALQLVAACLVPGQHTVNRTDALTSMFF
jgi:hypothetical protein